MASNVKRRQNYEKQKQDALGISRKKWKFKVSPEFFFITKLLLIILIPIMYFVYSPLIVVVLALYVGLFFLARGAEHSMNKSVIRANHIHIAKFDSAIALVVIVVAFFGAIVNSTGNTKSGMFENFSSGQISEFVGAGNFGKVRKSVFWQNLKSWLKNFGACLTGERNMLTSGNREFNFGSEKPPEDFASAPSDLPQMPNGAPDFDFSIDDVPVSYVFSSSLSTVNTVLIFSVAGMGALSLVIVFVKKRKFDKEMSEVIVDEKNEILSDEEIDRILSFGEDYESAVTQEEIDKKILQTEKEDAENLKNFEIVEVQPESPMPEEDVEILSNQQENMQN